MSEATPSTTPPAAPAAQSTPPTPTPPAASTPPATPAPQQTTDWETEAKKWEKRAKDNFEKAQKLDQIEAASKSDLEKLQDKLTTVEQEAKDGVVSAFREAAVTFGGIKPEDAETFLTGTDVDSLKKQAARLAQFSNSIPGHVPGEGNAPLALNSDGLEQALKKAVGA